MLQQTTSSTGKSYMAYQIASFPMTLSDLLKVTRLLQVSLNEIFHTTIQQLTTFK